MAKPDGGPDPKTFDDNIGTGHVPPDNCHQCIKDVKDWRKANFKGKDADPGAKKKGWFHVVRIEYLPPPGAEAAGAKTLKPSYGYKRIREFNQLTAADVDLAAQAAKRGMLTQLAASMANRNVNPSEWRTIVRIAPSNHQATDFDEGSCGCGCSLNTG